MIYTIGKKSIYDIYIKNDINPRKLGKTDNYPGGSVWRYKKEVEKFLTKGYEVYGVLADWEKDTKQSNDGKWNDLLKSSKLRFIND